MPSGGTFSRVWVLALSLVLVGTSAALAQNTLPPPIPVYPLSDTPNVPDFISIDDGEVAIMPVQGATRYRICVKGPVTEGTCGIFDQTFAATQGIAGPSGSLRFFVQIPLNRQNSVGHWSVSACNNTTCFSGSVFQTFLVLPRSATTQAPATAPAGIIPANRNVTFPWTNNVVPNPGTQSNAGTQLIILPSGPQQLSGYSSINPTQVPAPGLSIPVNQGLTSQPVTLPQNLPAIKWAVLSCHDFGNVTVQIPQLNGTATTRVVNKGRRCTARNTAWRSMRVPDFFSTVIVPTLLHPRCVNCHAVAADNFQNDPQSGGNGGLPFGHQQVTSATDNAGGCASASCHNDGRLPLQGDINPGWHAAPATKDFRKRPTENEAQHVQRLCALAQETVTHPQTGQPVNGYGHMTRDKLILWAVNANANGNVQLPGTAARPPAPPGSIVAWQNAVYTWWFIAQRACD